MDISYSIIPKSQIHDDLLILCSHLFNNNYGVWSPQGLKPGEAVKMGIKGIKENLLFNSQCSLVIAKLDNNLVGYCFNVKFYQEKLSKVCWITQLVVDKNIRNRGIAKNLIYLSSIFYI